MALSSDSAAWAAGTGSPTLSPNARSVAAQTGLSVARCEQAVDRLRSTGVLVPADGPYPTTNGDHVAFDPALLAATWAAASIAWPIVLSRLAGDGAGLLVLRAFADIMRRPNEYASVERAVIAVHAGYSEGMVKHGIAAVTGARLVERGGRTLYRFTDLALGRELDAPAPELPSPSTPVSPAPSTEMGAGTLVSFGANGIRLELPRDTTIELETEVDGARSVLRLRFPSR